MQSKDVLVYREHAFSYADHEREVMHVVTRLGHVHIGEECR